MTIPNLIAGARLVSAPLLVILGAGGRELAVLVLFLVLEASDWLDGKLAIWLDQRSETGARLDTVADLAMYAGFLAALVVLQGERLASEWAWITPALVSYAASWALSLAKFGVLPSYHTWTAKFSAFLATTAAVTLLAFDDVIALRVATVGVTIANIEAILISRRLDRARSDVRSILTLR